MNLESTRYRDNSKEIKAYLERFGINAYDVLVDDQTSEGYYRLTHIEPRTAQNYREFVSWPDGFDFGYLDSLVNPNISNRDDYPGEWTKNQIREVILEVLLEFETAKLKNRTGER